MKKNKNKILVVDDDASLREIYSTALRTMGGYEVFEAVNGAEGLMKAEKEVPDLILLDILMPVMDGLTMLERLRESEDERLKKMPVLLLTNLSANQEETIKRVAQTQPLYYMVKASFTVKDIVAKVKEFLPVAYK